MVLDVLADLLAAVEDGTLARGLDNRVLGPVERGELRLVLVGRDMALLDVGDGDGLFVLDLAGVLLVDDRLDVVLDVVDCRIAPSELNGGVSESDPTSNAP